MSTGSALDDVDLAAHWAPPEDAPSYREFARSVLIPDGPSRGLRLDPASEPALDVVLRVLDGEIVDSAGQPFREIVDCAATQTGKSLRAILIPTLRATTRLRQSVIYCQPTADLINKVWVDKLFPSLVGCGFAAWIPAKGPGSRGGRPTSLALLDPATQTRAGSIIFVAGGQGKKREAGQAGVTAPIVLLDEADEYEDAHRLALVAQRAASYGADAVVIKASTVKKDVNSVILAEYAASTASRLWFACPHCGAFQPLEWSRVRYDATDSISARESARYHCGACDVGWTDEDRLRALRVYRLVHQGQTVSDTGEILGPIPRVRAFGLRTSKLDYAIGYGLGDLADEHRKAKALVDATGDHGLMRSFTRDRLSMPYQGDAVDAEGEGRAVDAAYIAARAASPANPLGNLIQDKEAGESSHYWCEAPRCATMATLAVDVQGDRVYWLLTAWDDQDRSYDIGWGYDFACERESQATPAQYHAILDRVDAMVSAGIGGSPWAFPISIRGIDVGYHQSDLMPWVRSRAGWRAVKGLGETQANGAKAALEGDRYADGRHDVPGMVAVRRQRDGSVIWFVHSDQAREQAQRAFLIPAGQPGAAHAPRGLKSSDAYCKHLASRRLDRGKTGDRKWVRVQLRDDYLACRTYAVALRRHSILKPTAPASEPAPPPPSDAGAPDWVGADTRWDLGTTTWR